MTTEHDMAVAMATEIGKQVPVKQVYEEAGSPAARQVGATLEDVVKCIRLVGFPIQWLAVQQDRFRHFLERAKSNIPREEAILPEPRVLGPILEGIRYETVDNEIVELFAGLLNSSMRRDRAHLVHPMFLAITKALDPDEARILLGLCQGRFVITILNKTIDGISQPSVERTLILSEKLREWGVINIEGIDFYIENLVRNNLIYGGYWTSEYIDPNTNIDKWRYELIDLGKRYMAACGRSA